MNRILIFLGLVLFICRSGFAQTGDEIEKTKIGLFKNQIAYKKCGITMTDQQLMELFKDDPNMEQFLKPLALNYIGDILFSTAASILIFYPLGQRAYGNDEPNWNLAYIGAGCALLSIPFKKGFEKNADKAVKFYNNGYKIISFEFNLNLNSDGLGIALRF